MTKQVKSKPDIEKKLQRAEEIQNLIDRKEKKKKDFEAKAKTLEEEAKTSKEEAKTLEEDIESLKKDPDYKNEEQRKAVQSAQGCPVCDKDPKQVIRTLT